MKTRFTLLLAAMASAASLLVGCTDSASPTEPKMSALPTPTPIPPTPSGSIGGAWTGKFDPADFVDCDSNTPAQATFSQDGSTVIGTLNATENGCGFMGVTFEGTLRGNVLAGTVKGGGFNSGSALGTLSGASLEIALTSACPGALCIPGGQMHLHR